MHLRMDPTVLNRCETLISDMVSTSDRPSRFEWAVAVFMVIVQQGAFASSIYGVLHPGEEITGGDNIFYSLSTAISMVLLAIVSTRALPQLQGLLLRNPFTILYILVALSSAIWSLHPDLTLRKGVIYVQTIGVAGYIAARFTTEQALRVLAKSFEICAVSSVIFVALYPDIGLMHGSEFGDGQELNGNWRGVYLHKNGFGFNMAIAVLAQLTLIALSGKQSIRAYAWVAFYFVLIVLSKSATALVIGTSYFLVSTIYTFWTKNKLFGYTVLLVAGSGAIALLLASYLDAELFLGLLGKDPTLTGRTEIWAAVGELIDEKPIFGWGYRAMWVPTDQVTMWVDRRCGDWGVPSAHNAMLEIELELGMLGVSALVILIVQAFWRGIRCCLVGLIPLGLFSLAFFVATIIAGQTIETLGIGQELDWFVFTTLSFIAGERLAATVPTELYET